MNRIELTEGVYWVGTVDWNIRDFHGKVTPKGTTYNAYLMVDEKVALVDTVKQDFYQEMLERISEITDPKNIDYVISNHVEIDHSGALPQIMKEAVKAKVVATEKGKEGLYKYYRGDWNFVTVKTGDELNLGKRNLLFISAPMLHWPDSMFTYLKEDAILMPNDAFGQHLASSQRFEDEIGEEVMEEAKSYYANILMPFANLILKKVKELQQMNLKIDMIAPSHGAIWRKEPERIVQAYVNWSKGQTKEKVLVIYDSMWGSTDKMARAIAEGVSAEGIEVKLCHLRKMDWSYIVKELLDARAIFFGSPTQNGGMFWSVGGFLTYLKGLRPKGKIGAAFGSYGWGARAVKEITEELKLLNWEVVEPGLSAQYVPTAEELTACFDLGQNIAKKVRGH